MDTTAEPRVPYVNWLLFGELGVVVIVACAFFLYFNRLFGAVFAWCVRLYTWRKHHAYISIGSLQFAPLAGRIAFRNVEYHSSNISVRVLHGHITFRYWSTRVKQEGDAESNNAKRAKNECRLVIFADGVECFVYNRTPAYDAIVERMKKHEQESRTSTPSKASSEENPIKVRLRKAFRSTHQEDGLAQLNSNNSSNDTDEKPDTTPESPSSTVTPEVEAVDWFRELCPIELRIEKGSVILGSDATPMILIADFRSATGTVEITDSRSVCDKYKMSIPLRLEDVKVLYRTNVEWSGPLLAHGKKVYDELLREDPDLTKQPPSSISTKTAFLALARRFHFLLSPTFSIPPRAGMPRDKTWRGLARYWPESTKAPPKHEREYAKVTTLVDTPELDLTYYSDTPGVVPHPDEIGSSDPKDKFGNVDVPPEYGIDVVIHGGMVQYGPWADRQREALQKTFAPNIFFDSEPKSRLRAGETRVHADLVVSVTFSEETNLRIPTREPSKDWQFDAKPEADLERPYGWLDVTAGADSTISYTQSQFATAQGYGANLVLHLKSLSIASSINLQSFVDAKSCRLTLAMPVPLGWDAQRNWGIDMHFDTPDITLLRDHVTLISDIAKDWSSGAEGDFHHFVPVHYNFKIGMNDYAFHLYINDCNIVDRPQSRDDNSFVDIMGPTLSAYTAIASTQYRPEFSVIPFTVNLNDARLEISIPKWDTHRSFQSQSPIEIGRIGTGSASGSYRYYSHPHPDHEEALTLHLDASKVAFKCMGWVLRRLFCVKDNYFGMFTQFTTTQEYLERFDHDPNSVGDPVEEKYRPGRSDPFAVQVTLDVRDSLVLLSDEIFACESGLALPIPQLQMVLRSVEAFMELSLDLPPTYIVAAPSIEQSYVACRSPSPSSTESVCIEGIIVKANRLFGPQPHGTTYLCLWEIAIPKVTAFLTPAFLATVQSSITAVAFNFSDKENAPTDIYIPVTPPDVTFFKLAVGPVSAIMYGGDAAAAVDLPGGVVLDTSSLATLTSSSSLAILVPSASVNLLTRLSSRQKWTSAGSFYSGVSVDIYKAPKDWQEKAQKQQKFLREEDEPTQRIWYMYAEKEDTSKTHHKGSSYLPRPYSLEHGEYAPGLKLMVDDSGTEDEETEDEVGPEVDSSDSDREDQARPKIKHHRSRSRSFRTAKETFEDSSGESDDVSSVASSASSRSPSESGLPPDMSSILADHARKFSRFAQSRNAPTSPTPGFGIGPKLPSSPLPNGTMIRVRVEPLLLQASLAGVSPVLALADAMSVNHSRPLQIVDGILDQLIDNFNDRNGRPVPSIIDITAPSIGVSLSTSSAVHDPVSRVALDIGGVISRISRAPADGHSPSSSASVSMLSLHTTLYSTAHQLPKLSLNDINLNHPHTPGAPVLQLDQLGLQMAFNEIGKDRQIRVHATSTDLKLVSAALSTATETAGIWRDRLAKLEMAKAVPQLGPLLVAAVKSAGPNAENAPLPAFATELTYELHVDDDRNIRRDHGWRIISRLRQILLLTPVAPGDFPTADQSAVQGLSLLDWVPDENNEALTRQLPFVQKAFDLPHPQPDTEEASSSEAAFVSIENVVIRHYDYLLGTGRVGSSFVRMGTTSAGLYRTKLSGKPGPDVQDRAVLAVSSIDGEIQDSIFPVVRHFSAASASPSSSSHPSAVSAGNSTFLVNAHLGSGDMCVLAGGLKLRTVVNNATGVLGHLQRQHSRNGLSSYVTVRNDITVVLDKADVVLLQPSDDDNPSNSADREVVVIGVSGLKVVSDTQGSTKPSSVKERKVVLALQMVVFDSKPTLRRALDFAQVWKEKHYPHYEPTINQMRSTIAANPARVPQPNRIPVSLTFDILVLRASLTVRTAKAAWIGWQVGRFYACQNGSAKNHSFGIRAAPQSIGFYSSRDLVKTKDTVKLDLPRVDVDGTLKTIQGQGYYEVQVNLGLFACIVKPSALDKLLSLYKSLVPEMRQLVKDYGSYAQTMFTPAAAPAVPTPTKAPDLFRLNVGVEGISIGLRADDVATTLLLRALALKGRATNRHSAQRALSWQAGVEHFQVSLGQIDNEPLPGQADNSRKYQSAYMYLDVDVYETPSDTAAPSRLGVSLSRIQTFMHIVALSEISDLISSWTSDLHDLTSQRGTEVAEVREQTSKFLKKIETSEGVKPEDSWFATRLLTVDIASFGLAVPLGAETVIDIRQASEITQALLFSIRSISFVNRRNETAQFRVQHIALQFVGEFNARMPNHFIGEFHDSINQMSLPLINAEAQMSSKADAWTLAAHSSATDFNLGLDPDFIEGIFQLIDLYERGKDRIDQLEKRYRAELSRNPAHTTATEAPVSPVVARQTQRIYLRLSFSFESGKVQLYRVAGAGQAGARASWHDEVVLPGISVWVDYAGPSTDGLADESDKGGLVIFNAAVHQSRNTLRPSILPFFVQVASRVEKRFKSKRSGSIPQPSPGVGSAVSTPDAVETTAPSLAAGGGSVNRLRLTLRIDQSELRFACNPDSQAYVNLRWESGGFLGSTTIGAEEASTFAGTITGVTTNLSHEYDHLGRSCIEASARDLTFSIIHTPNWRDDQAGVSIVMDTRVSAQFRLDLFSAWLTFVAVWVDNAGLDKPIIAAIGDPSTVAAAVPAPPTSESKQIGIAILARFQAIDFDADVTVSHAKLKISPVILHTLSNGSRTRVDLQVGKTEITAAGDISGTITVDNFAFETVRKSTRATEDTDPQLLKLELKSGDLRASLFLGEANIVRFHMGTTTVGLHDDWKDPSKPPLLAFAVQAGQLSMVVRLLAIPRLLGKVYEVLDAVGTQHRIASQRSETFKAHKAKKTSDPSSISTALAQTMQRTASNQAASLGSYTVFSQTMQFKLAGIAIGAYNELDNGKVDFYCFTVGNIEADLLREPKRVDGEDRPFRRLGLRVGLMHWDAVDGYKITAVESKDSSPEDLLKYFAGMKANRQHQEVAYLPEMDLVMDSDEYKGTPTRLLYHFALEWGKTKGDIRLLPGLFDDAFRSMRNLIAKIEQEEATRARRLGVIRPAKVSETEKKEREKREKAQKDKEKKEAKQRAKERAKAKGKDGHTEEPADIVTADGSTHFEPRDRAIETKIPVPKLEMTGDLTQNVAQMFPDFDQAVTDLPKLSHKFVTLKLEEGMDLLLKLYAKQLPAKKG